MPDDLYGTFSPQLYRDDLNYTIHLDQTNVEHLIENIRQGARYTADNNAEFVNATQITTDRIPEMETPFLPPEIRNRPYTIGADSAHYDAVEITEIVDKKELNDKLEMLECKLRWDIASKVYEMMERIIDMPLTEEEFINALMEG